MLISHELPYSLFPYNNEWNDYDYILAHLIGKDDVYTNFYLNRDSSRISYLDNSAFELGKSIEVDDFIEKIKITNPTYYIIPDKVNSMKSTKKMLDNWMVKYAKSINSKPMAVLQGTSTDVMLDLIPIIQSFDIDFIAIPYKSKAFSSNTLERCIDRVTLVQTIVNEYPSLKIHLLGCQSPYELSCTAATYPKNVISIDTSHPIITALNGISYMDVDGVEFKGPQQMVDHLDWNPTELEMKILKSNITIFRNLCNQ